jgi:hypothetical protein
LRVIDNHVHLSFINVNSLDAKYNVIVLENTISREVKSSLSQLQIRKRSDGSWVTPWSVSQESEISRVVESFCAWDDGRKQHWKLSSHCR